MESLRDLLPFIFILAILSSRFRKNVQSKSKRNSVPRLNPLREKTITKDPRYHKEEAQKFPMAEDVLPSVDIVDVHVRNEVELEEYILKERDDFERTINTPGIQIMERDVISKGEIGKLKIQLDKVSLVNSIIMLEVLGKPKALRKYKP